MATQQKPTLLKIDSSPMGERSVSRKLTDEFAKTWLKAHPGGKVIERDLTTLDIPVVNGVWVAAAYTPDNAPHARTERRVGRLGTADFGIAERRRVRPGSPHA